MDPMIRLYYDENKQIIENVDAYFGENEYNEVYGKDVIQEIFRAVHTLKADATMMLCEGIAEVSRLYEKLLYYFRNNDVAIIDKSKFIGVFKGYTIYVSEELDNFVSDKEKVIPRQDLENEIRSWLDELISSGESKELANQLKVKLNEKDKRQVYYIPALGSNIKNEEYHVEEYHDENIADNEGVEVEAGSYVVKQEEKKVYTQEARKIIEKEKEKDVSEEDTGKLSDSHLIEVDGNDYMKMFNSYVEMVDYFREKASSDNPAIDRKDLDMLKKIENTMLGVIKDVKIFDFTQIVKRMDNALIEMSGKLKKPVKLLCEGENIQTTMEIRDKLSGALIHVVRNAMDHGIESMDIREKLGKPPMGLIKMKFENMQNHIVVTVTDDGF